MEDHDVAFGLQTLHHDSCAGQSGVTTKRYFSDRCEPTQAIVTACRGQECRLAQIVLGSYSLEDDVVQKASQWHHRRWVPCEPASGKSVKVEYRYAHFA